MLSSPDPRTTQPLPDASDKRVDTSTFPSLLRMKRPETRATSARLPVVIPITEKRPRSLPPATSAYRRRPAVLLTAMFGCIAILLIGALFVVPLDNGQPAFNITQTFTNWFSTGKSGALNPSSQVAPPTPTPALLTSEGSCGGTNLWETCATDITASGIRGTGQLHRPILGAVITQYFGHPEYQFWCGCWRPHTGIDLAASFGTPIMAADTGQVIWTGWDVSGLGWAVKINHGRYVATVYGHMERFIVRVGQNVTQGQVIGYEGSTGASTGPHLHFMVLYNNIWVDPLNYVQLP